MKLYEKYPNFQTDVLYLISFEKDLYYEFFETVTLFKNKIFESEFDFFFESYPLILNNELNLHIDLIIEYFEPFDDIREVIYKYFDLKSILKENENLKNLCKINNGNIVLENFRKKYDFDFQNHKMYQKFIKFYEMKLKIREEICNIFA